ncbi:MAG: hypothetical protein JW779_11480, partial [Candidatus Thorarchaeota archaeon]|nr:hypothetical protein [Candidatus Thorarchaeota archaeon]
PATPVTIICIEKTTETSYYWFGSYIDPSIAVSFLLLKRKFTQNTFGSAKNGKIFGKGDY